MSVGENMRNKGALCDGCPHRFKIATKGQPFHKSDGPILGSRPPVIVEMKTIRARRSADRRTCCHVMRGLRIGFRNAKRNRARSPEMYCTNHRAWSPLLSLSNSIVFGVNGSSREAFGGVGWSLGTSFGGRGGDGDADPVNIIAACKASVGAARAAVSPVNGTGKGTGPTTSSPSVSWPAPGTSTSVRLACGNSAMAVVKRR